MSRYRIPTQDPRRYAVVGWDNPMQTFFGQVRDPTRPEDEAMVLEITGVEAPVTTVAALQALLQDYAHIPEGVCLQLEADYEAATVPTPLQRQVARLFGGEAGLQQRLWRLNSQRRLSEDGNR